MQELKLSPDFTIEDIHKLRQYDYERRKGMTEDEIIADIKKSSNEMLAILAKLKKEKSVT